MEKRNTIQKQLVLDAVAQLADHPTADEVYAHIAQKHPTVSKATVDVYKRQVTHPAASDVYEVRNEQGEVFLFPAVKEFLGELKPEEGFITVRPIAGMFTRCV